jgi:two-component system invasion response regulator UvrY
LIRLLLVDDHDLVRSGLMRMLQDVAGLEVTGEAASGEQAYSFCRKHSVDIVLMDMRMPGMGGMEATRKITRAFKSTRVIALTGSKDELMGSQFLKAGASGLLYKDSRFSDLLDAIQLVYKGGRYLCDDLAKRLALRTVETKVSPFEALTERELQTCLMITGSYKIGDIADFFHVSPKTINTYRYRIFAKLQVSGDVEMALMMVRHRLVEINGTPSG